MRGSIIDDLKAVLDKNGLVSPTIPPTESGNGIRYTAQALMLLKTRIPADSIDEYEELQIQLINSILKCEIAPGLYRRSPTHPDQEGPDDYVALTSANEYLAKRVLSYGRAHHYFFNNECPSTVRHRTGKINWSAWLGRQPQLIAHFHFAAGEIPPWWTRLVWCGTIFLSAHAKPLDQDGWALSYFLVRAVRGQSWICEKVGDYWRKRFLKAWPDGMPGVMRSYLGYPDHPLANPQYWFPEEPLYGN